MPLWALHTSDTFMKWLEPKKPQAGDPEALVAEGVLAGWLS